MFNLGEMLPTISDAAVLAASAVGFGGSSLLLVSSAKASIAAFAQLSRPKPRDNWYEDDDGKCTPESMAQFSNKSPKRLCLVLAVAAFGASVAISVLGTLHAETVQGKISLWLLTASWVCSSLCCETLCESFYADICRQSYYYRPFRSGLTSLLCGATRPAFASLHLPLQLALRFSRRYSRLATHP